MSSLTGQTEITVGGHWYSELWVSLGKEKCIDDDIKGVKKKEKKEKLYFGKSEGKFTRIELPFRRNLPTSACLQLWPQSHHLSLSQGLQQELGEEEKRKKLENLKKILKKQNKKINKK